MADQTIILRRTRDKLGSRFLGATLTSDGTVTIRGQDLGRGVAEVFGAGNTEYEWVWTIPPDSVTALCKSLDCGDDVLAGLQSNFSGDDAAKLKSYLDESGIQYKASSRLGD
ncbi:MAG: hypothetical protein AB8B55_06150 [Mariniblastus sp.]